MNTVRNIAARQINSLVKWATGLFGSQDGSQDAAPHTPVMIQMPELGIAEDDVHASEPHAEFWGDCRERELTVAIETWDGNALDVLPIHLLEDYPHLANHPALRVTVANALRAPVIKSSSKSVRQSLRVVAVDRNGMALVEYYAVDVELDADGSSYRIMALGKAALARREFAQ